MKMRKGTVILCIILLLFVLSGCSEKPKSLIIINSMNVDDIVTKKDVVLENLSFTKIPLQITNDSTYCSGEKTFSENYFSCFCQEGYAKITMTNIAKCIPGICSKIYGAELIGDIDTPNFLFCGQEADACRAISYSEGRDLCYLTNVLKTGNYSICNFINNSYLKGRCEEFTYTFCNVDEDCVLEAYPENHCCDKSCQNFGVNKLTAERRAKWRETNCTVAEQNRVEKSEPPVTSEEWSRWWCLWLYVECTPTYYKEAYCDNGICKEIGSIYDNL